MEGMMATEKKQGSCNGGAVHFPEEMCEEPTCSSGNLNKESNKRSSNRVGTEKTTWVHNEEGTVGNRERTVTFAGYA